MLTFLDVLGRTSNVVDANKIFKFAQVNRTKISLQKKCNQIHVQKSLGQTVSNNSG